MPRDTHAESELLAEATPLTPRQQFEQAETLHEILAMAIEDFEAVLDDPRYVVCFGSWHGPVSARQTAVCFAGAVMAKRLGAEIDWNTGPENFEDDAQVRLQSLYRLSIGDVVHAASSQPQCESWGELIGEAEWLLQLSPLQLDAAERLSEQWEPILGLTYGAALDEVDVWWFLACMRGMLADLIEEGL